MTDANRKRWSWWLLLVLVLMIIGLGLYLYPREQQVLTKLTAGETEPLFNSTTIMNTTGTTSAKTLLAIMHTSAGDITLELYPDKATNTVANFVKLAKSGFYNGTLFHRVIKGFMIQGGDPLTKTDPTNWSVHGTGGPGYTFADEYNDLTLERGVLAMANSGTDTNGSQFFIMTARQQLTLQGYYTAFGRVIGDYAAVDKIEAAAVNNNDHPLEDQKILSIDITER